MADTTIQWTQSPPIPRDVVLPRTMRIPGLGDGCALPKGHVLAAGSRVGGFTFNAWLGCTKVSPGCQHCYAEVSQTTKMRQGGPVLWGPNEARVRTAASTWRKPLTWNRTAEALGVPLFVFAQSLSDTFEDRADLEGWRLELFDLIKQTPHLRWLLLTKRPEVMARFAAEHGWPENAWAGTTVEDQRRADERIPHLLRVPAPVRFLSLEPLLGPVDLRHVQTDVVEIDALTGDHGVNRPLQGRSDARIHWLIIGGESGPKARPMHPEWARPLIQQGREAGAAVHFKQWGAYGPSVRPRSDSDPVAYFDGGEPFGWGLLDQDRPHIFMRRLGKKAAGRIIDGREWNEVPRG